MQVCELWRRDGGELQGMHLVWEGRRSLASGRRSKLRTRTTVSVPFLAVKSTDLVGTHLAVTQVEVGARPDENLISRLRA